MTREEIEKISVSKPYRFKRHFEKIWYEVGCIDGLRAADAEPNLESLWHDMSEMPKESKDGVWILMQFGEDSYDTFMTNRLDAAIWNHWSKKCYARRWAYVNDLLPKGGLK